MLRIMALVLALVVPSLAQAATVNATGYSNIDTGLGNGDANGRDNPDNILGAADGDFYEIGREGTIDLVFGLFGTPVDVTGPIDIIEITFGSRSNYVESFDVYAGFAGGAFTLVGNVTNAVAAAQLTYNGVFNTLRLVDTSTHGGGADIDSVSVRLSTDGKVGEVPLPAAAWLFLSVIGGAGVVRRMGSKA